jgi:hypothetical protein
MGGGRTHRCGCRAACRTSLSGRVRELGVACLLGLLSAGQATHVCQDCRRASSRCLHDVGTPQLIASLGTVIAISTSLFLLRQGQQDRRELRDERRREQAGLVTCWCDWNADSPDIDRDRLYVPAVFVRNASDQAIYQAFVDYYHPQHGLERIDIGPVPPGETRHRDVLADIPDDPRWEPSGLLPRLFFTDAGGQAWLRGIKGRLQPDPGPHRDGFSDEGGVLNLGLPRRVPPPPAVTE